MGAYGKSRVSTVSAWRRIPGEEVVVSRTTLSAVALLGRRLRRLGLTDRQLRR